MIKKTALMLFAVVGLFMTAPVDSQAQVAASSKKTSSVTASAPVRELCAAIDNITGKIAAGQFADAKKLEAKLEELDKKDVNNQVLTYADKELLKKTLNNFLIASVKTALKQQGINYDTLSAEMQKEIDKQIAQGTYVINDAVDKSKTLQEAGEVLNSISL